MKKKDVIKQYTTPIAAPAFVQGPHRFRRREYLNITYRTDREALEKAVPEPLELAAVQAANDCSAEKTLRPGIGKCRN